MCKSVYGIVLKRSRFNYVELNVEKIAKPNVYELPTYIRLLSE